MGWTEIIIYNIVFWSALGLFGKFIELTFKYAIEHNGE
jgi:hypothetical protein